ncbi:hypothetical protein [Planomonospora sp. ID82291]|uniref:hypothetical protein n=1 Tax=Planomonospora sp. ID82291 TaxID=2738136 RepID=UPI0018C40C92|nr:hypothetical protein [Planomonospora sp. ID82291]MBG0817828.1 hypothetical protein [Planomonospora sp. ID82291]
MEELDTGLVHRSRRVIRDGRVVLDTRDAPDVCPAGFSIGPVPSDGDPPFPGPSRRRTWRGLAALRGRHRHRFPPAGAGHRLAEAGMDVTVPRRSIAEGRLACWLQACVDDDRGGHPVGHAVASWEDERRTTARLDLVRIRPGVPPEVRGALVRLAVRTVTEDGASRTVTAIDVPELHGLGFRPGPGGLLRDGREHG